MVEVYFFGCIGEVGHYLFAPPATLGRSGTWQKEREIKGWPWRWGELDGKYAPGGEHRDKLGPATVTHHKGWTVLAMWDRSVDRRLASNAAFIARGEYDFQAMLELAGKHFFAVFERIQAQAPLVDIAREAAKRRCQAARKAWLDPDGPEVRCECGHLIEQHCLDDDCLCVVDPEVELAGACLASDCECIACRPESAFDFVGRQLGGRELRDGDGRRIA